MKQVYVLRHGPKDKSGQLTKEGKEQIKQHQGKFREFNLILASEMPRAQQTARLLTGSEPYPDSRANIINITKAEEEELFELGKQHPFGIAGVVFETPKYNVLVKKQGYGLVDLIQEVLTRLGDNEKALIISHDGPMAAAERILKGLSLDTIERNYQPFRDL